MSYELTHAPVGIGQAPHVVATVHTATAAPRAASCGATASGSRGSRANHRAGEGELHPDGVSDQGWVQPAEGQLAKQFQQQTGITVKYDILPDSPYQTFSRTTLTRTRCPGTSTWANQHKTGSSSTRSTKHAVDLSNQPWVKHGRMSSYSPSPPSAASSTAKLSGTR